MLSVTNFDYLLEEPQFKDFVQIAIAAEKVAVIDPATSVIDCRRAMELAVKWMYSVDSDLKTPYQDKLVTLINTLDFKDIVDPNTWQGLELIRRLGNVAVHTNRKVSLDEAILCLKALFSFFDMLDYCYGSNYQKKDFDKSIVGNYRLEFVPKESPIDTSTVSLEKLTKKNKSLQESLTAQRKAQEESYTPKPFGISEFKTRKIYIDTMLAEAGWIEGQNWLNEVELTGMPNKAGKGYADYVLYDDAHLPLAVIEAKKTCKDVAVGRQQAKLYADILENKYGRRPVVFLSNGFETRIIDNQYPERQVSSIYSKRDLEKLFNLQKVRQPLTNIVVDDNIAGRYYQKAAIQAVCESFSKENRRKALLVMATGSGKTRTAVGLVKVLLNAGWIKHVLFLTDRDALVTQAKKNFATLLQNLSTTNLVEDKKNYNARCVFSTYATMMNVIDTAMDDEKQKLYTAGHFDLIIVDEAHRSIYNKYRNIFTYFDAPLIGLTATPKDDIDKNTYSIFDLEDGVPTYGYDLAQAVDDGYLVPYKSIETHLKFMEKGIKYDDLTDQEKEEYEETFTDEDGELPKKIESGKLNKWLFNKDTIRKVLNILMSQGLRINYGERIGKTIIFAKNHRHAEEILKVFNEEYPQFCKNSHGQPYATVIDNYTNYSQSAINEFSDPNKLPQIAISVDMLDTGIDVPECLNLVFFKKVMSKAKFFQMIGRGTRLCPNLLDGKDKKEFYIFDFGDNFQFFRMEKGHEAGVQETLQSALFNLKMELVRKLQEAPYQTEDFKQYRKSLIEDLSKKVKELNRKNFAVKQHLAYVDKFSQIDNYNNLTYEDIVNVQKELAPLILPDNDEPNALRFDALVYKMELAKMSQESYGRLKIDLCNKISKLSDLMTIPQVKAKAELIKGILEPEYVESTNVQDLEHIRQNIRDLIQYLPKKGVVYYTNFTDTILDSTIHDAELETDTLKNYKAKAEFYIKQHQSENLMCKIRDNEPLSSEDLRELEDILWQKLGSKEEYQKEIGDKTPGEFVRSIIGLDINAAKKAFSKYLDTVPLNKQQIYFINEIIEYIVKNGTLTDMHVLQESPFTNQGSISELFESDITIWLKVKTAIDEINSNAGVGAA
ncbi:DEAD/DEAH box helicase family protein [Lactobacillus johnsonii]|uniref:Restriction endonuclease subunit R n=1 Tax=Lactobacillus johnsonii TaxID=33959 RepID=A0A9X6P599_LACJH|nr:DEAD/DEAH box helicase family protein [Lactobacillus johnsonii]OYS05111.1 restriction endonuclease subunit R [Lactobacillus johnsonii]OYS07181.1 restriction endonuclease subunit R [Lactobacillus johnsonii]OYS07546.1 restriction endonuclease subunit R [Lactobacillus johnsonii]OYS09700.1 restriction endonuclease subunit R [Lactobacillus johnsonii]OYS12670.1 restriction endonuclease subunit R [Lactobacillus johnsonii]